jgi:hypothetical protein
MVRRGSEEEISRPEYERLINPDWHEHFVEFLEESLWTQRAWASVSVPIRVQAAARASRRRSVRTSPRRANGPPSDDDSSPEPLEVVSLSRFRRDVRRWQEGAA